MATPKQLRRRGRLSLVLGAIVATVLFAAVAFAADLQTDADLSTNVLAPTEVEIGDNSFEIKVWATGSVNNPNATGQATVVNKYFMATNGAITPSADPADRTTLTFTQNVNYSQNPPCGLTAATSIQGCPNNPFVVSAELVVAAGTADGTAGLLTVSNAGSPGLTADTTPDTGRVEVDAGDTAPPTLNLPADITAEATSSAGAVVTFTATADDADPAHPTVSCSPASGSTFALGTTTVNCSATDAAGNTANGSFKVTVQDTTGPVIAAHADVTAEATGPSGASVSYTAPAAVDAVDGPRAVSCSPASGSTFPLGDTTVNCSSSDTRGNSSSSSFKVTVQDTTPPALSGVPGDMTLEATGPLGAVATWTAPTASDLVDGSRPVTCAPASGSTFAIGTTEVKCSAEDTRGNKAEQSFNVTVRDTTPPTISGMPSDMTLEATGPGGAAASWTAPTASDLVDGSVAVLCSPVSGSTFAIGTTEVKCSAEDSRSNKAVRAFNVTVQDTTGPALSLPANITAEATGPSGAVVTYSASANDLVDGVRAVNCSPASGGTFPLGETTVSCSSTDTRGNPSNGSFKITVVDTTGPALSLPGDMVVVATSASSAVVTFTATASDLVDGSRPVTCNPASGTTFVVGTTTVNCSSTDTRGNLSSGSFNVTVNYAFTGFFRPIDNLPVINVVKAGSAVPVKFSLSGNQGLGIFASGYPASIVIPCDSTALLDAVEETLTAGNSSLSYDAVADQYSYVWKTEKSWTGCRQLVVKLSDGSYRRANFKFTR